MGSDHWKGLKAWVEERLLAEKLVSEDDLDIFQILDDPEEIVDAVKKIVIL